MGGSAVSAGEQYDSQVLQSVLDLSPFSRIYKVDFHFAPRTKTLQGSHSLI